MARKRRLGWIGIAIVITGALVALVGLYVLLANRPQVGDVIDTIAIDGERSLVIRGEAGGERNFVELVEQGEPKWRALVPPYAGRPGAPGIAWGKGAITVRVIRDGRAEVFALAMTNASKLGGFKLAPGKGNVVKQTTGPVTLTDHERAYEVVAGAGWVELVAIDLATGEALWRQDLGERPVDAAKIEDGAIWIEQAGRRRGFGLVTGAERSSKPT
jgi:outer membrane protein assembly factor BamB